MSQKDFSNWLVVSDIDGTLNNKARKLPRRNYDAIQAFTEAGGNFTLASGRLTSSLKRNYDRITPNQPAVVLNGAGIYDFQQEKMIWRSTIQQEGHEFVRYIINKFMLTLIFTVSPSLIFFPFSTSCQKIKPS